MSHERIPNNFRRLNKKKLVVASIFIIVIVLVVLLLVVAVIAAVINAVSGQVDSGLGKSISDIIPNIWNGALEFIQALWKQVLANPLQFLTGGGS